ncbi:MAG: ribosome small subunit-dependent GTPase A [Thermoleophilia bacterium]
MTSRGRGADERDDEPTGPVETTSPGLARLGWDDDWAAAFAALDVPGLEPARIAAQHRGGYTALGDVDAFLALLPGRLLRHARRTGERPAVGDWVGVRRLPEQGRASIEGVLPRRSKFSRRAAGESDAEQVVAANVDVVLLVLALDVELDVRGLERYLATAHESGASPVVVLTKADLVPDAADAVTAVRQVAGDVPVHVISNRTAVGVDALRGYLAGDRTVALLGASGVGKSSLVNVLLGEERQLVGEVRADGSGRHTTTHRALIFVPGGGLVLDTPGMRELQLWEADEGVEATFADVEELAEECRFPDCRHESEPGCAVQDAIAAGELDEERVTGYRALRAELEELAERQEARARLEHGRAERASRHAARTQARRS